MLLSSSNRKYPPFPLFSYFFVVVCLRCLLHHILHFLCIHSGKTGNLFSLVLCSLWWVQIVGYVLACRSYSFVCTLQHLIIIIVQTLSEAIELIKCLSAIICRVCKIKHILSVIHYTVFGAVCFQFTNFLRDDWENILFCHHQIGSMNWTFTHCLRLGHETMVWAVCLSIFLCYIF